MKYLIIPLLVLSLAFVCLIGTNGAANKTYKFSIARCDKRFEDDTFVGVETTILCDRVDLDTMYINSARLSWFVKAENIPPMPITEAQFHTYVRNYLKAVVGTKKRYELMMEEADRPVVSHTPIAEFVGGTIVVEE